MTRLEVAGIGEQDGKVFNMGKCGSLYQAVDKFIEDKGWDIWAFGMIGNGWDIDIRFTSKEDRDTAHIIMKNKFAKAIKSNLIILVSYD